MPNPIFLIDDKEDGINTLRANKIVKPDTAVLPACDCWEDVEDALSELAAEKHSFKTLVIDTIGGLERLCHEFVCRTEYEGNWGESGFTAWQRGYRTAIPVWNTLLTSLDKLRADRSMAIMFLGHSQIKTRMNPSGPDWDRFIPDIHERTWGATCKWADLVIFADYRVQVEAKKGEAKGKGKGGDTRIFYTEHSAAHEAKNRLSLPPRISMGETAGEAWANLSKEIEEANHE